MSRRLVLADLIEAVAGWRPSGLEMPVQPVVDSRKVEPGAVFFAFAGERADGHAFVADALARGAVAAVVAQPVSAEAQLLDLTTAQQPVTLGAPLLIQVPDVLRALQQMAAFWRRQFAVRVIGVTGSVGKTTTKEVVSKVLASRYTVLRSLGSYNNEIGLPLTLLALTGEHERLILEMGMYTRGDIRALAQIAHPDVGVVTNVEPVHMERAGTLENITLAKQELVEALPAAAEGGVAVLNDDDPRVRGMAEATRARVFFYGLSSQADVWADEVESLGLEGIRIRLHYRGEQLYVRAPLLGRHSVHTVLRAAAVGLVEGLNWQEIIEGVRAPGPQLRLVTVRGPQDSLILDDTYNSSPPSALAALNLLDDLEGRKIAVLGDMLELGEYEIEGHRKVGCRAADVVAHLVVTGHLAEWIAEGARVCGLPKERVHIAIDNAAAAQIVREILEPQDVILIKGSRGMHMETIVAALTKE